MDFITVLPKNWRKHDSIMVVVDKLTKAVNFIPVKSTHKMDDIAKIFMKEIFKLHGFPKAIVSGGDVKFTSNFWKGLFTNLGTKLNFNMHTILRHMGRQRELIMCLKTCFACM